MKHVFLLSATFFILQVIAYKSETVAASSSTSTRTHSIRQNFDTQCERYIGEQVKRELEASYFYWHYANYFQQFDVALPGFHEMFEYCSKEERDHAQLLIDYVYKRGGKVKLQSIDTPDIDPNVETVTDILIAALEKEKDVNKNILELHGNCSNNDPHFQDFLEASLINEQVESIHDLGMLVTRMRRCAVAPHNVPLCEHTMDHELLEEYSKKKP